MLSRNLLWFPQLKYTPECCVNSLKTCGNELNPGRQPLTCVIINHVVRQSRDFVSFSGSVVFLSRCQTAQCGEHANQSSRCARKNVIQNVCLHENFFVFLFWMKTAFMWQWSDHRRSAKVAVNLQPTRNLWTSKKCQVIAPDSQKIQLNVCSILKVDMSSKFANTETGQSLTECQISCEMCIPSCIPETIFPSIHYMM